jgi:hypothetical protein
VSSSQLTSSTSLLSAQPLMSSTTAMFQLRRCSPAISPSLAPPISTQLHYLPSTYLWCTFVGLMWHCGCRLCCLLVAGWRYSGRSPFSSKVSSAYGSLLRFGCAPVLTRLLKLISFFDVSSLSGPTLLRQLCCNRSILKSGVRAPLREYYMRWSQGILFVYQLDYSKDIGSLESLIY